MKTAIIIVTYNKFDLTNACLWCIMPLLQRGFEIAVVDNGSTDQTAQKIRENFPQVHLLELQKNMGYATATNMAIQNLARKGVDFDAICLLHNDVLPKLQSLPLLKNSLIKYKNTHQKEAIVAPFVKASNGSIQKNYYAKITPFQFFLTAFKSKETASKKIHGVLSPSSDPSLFETYRTNSICLMMSRSLWEMLGGFDQDIFLYHEDLDFAMRAKKLNIPYFMERQAIITHLGGESPLLTLTKAIKYDNSQEYVFQKHFGLKGKLFSKLYRFSRSFTKLLFSFPFIAFSPSLKKKSNIHLQLLKNIFSTP